MLCTDVRDNDGNTPLHDACSCGHLEVVKYLVETAHCDVGECTLCSVLGTLVTIVDSLLCV